MQGFNTGLAIAACSFALGACLIEDPGTETEIQSGGTFPPVTSFAERGSFATTEQALGACTVHRPAVLGQNGVTHPVILWGNGTGAAPGVYGALLSHLASHGFIAAAANTTNAGNGSQMLACLDALAAANNTPGSPFFTRVDTASVGASGHSQGGAGTIMAGRDARVDTTAPVQPYIGFIPGGGAFSQASIGQQQGRMLLLSGSADFVAVPSIHQRPVFNGVNQSVVWGTLSGATHFEPAGNAGRYREPLTAWFRARLMGDATAAAVFDGACTLCSASGWTVQRR